MSNEVTIFSCRTCEGTGLEKIYYQIPQCAGCGHTPLDLSASTCPRCHRSKYQTGFLHAQKYNTRKCTTCYGFKRMLLVKTTTPGILFGHNTSFRTMVASEINIARHAPHLALGSTINPNNQIYTNNQSQTNSELLSTIANYIANASEVETKYHYFDGKDQYTGTMNQIIATIKKNPRGTHKIHFKGEWCDASTLTPFNQYIPKKSAPKKAKPRVTKNTTPKKSAPSRSSRTQSHTRKRTKPEKPKPNLTYPFKEAKYDALCDGLQSIFGRFPYVDETTDKVRESLRSLFKEWRNGIDITKRAQPKLDRAIALIYALPERYLMLILDDLEAIEQNKHLVSKQRKSSYQAPQKDMSHYIYPRSSGSLHPLYSTLEDIREQFMKLRWPGKTGILGDKIAAFLEEWDDGIDPTKKSHSRLDDIVTTLYALKDYLLMKIITNLEHIEEHKHSIVNQTKRPPSKQRSPQPSGAKSNQHRRERFSARLLHEEIMEGNNGWLLELPTSILQTDNGQWNESRIGVVAKVLREHDSRVSFNVFLKWCHKYGNSDDLMLPILSNKKTMEDLFRQIWSSGQFKEEEFKGELLLKGSTELIQLKVT